MSHPRFSLTSLCFGACLLAAVGCGGGPAATPKSPEVVAPTVEPAAENPSESNPEKKEKVESAAVAAMMSRVCLDFMARL